MTGRLYVVGTPIGNLGDVTERARLTLSSVDLVAAEDTRRTGRLLANLGINVRTLSLFEGNEARRVDEVLELLRDGAQVAIVSDAGMPAVSDPGFRLLRAVVEEGIPVSVVPGPSAVTAALVVSGLPTDRWVFEGFLPRRAGERRERLRALAHDPRTVVLFESPRRLIRLLREIAAELGDRRAAVARELTKMHEEVHRGHVSDLLAELADSEPRGEIVVVLEGAGTSGVDLADMVDEARRMVAGGMRKRQAAAAAAQSLGGSANEIYRALIGSGSAGDRRTQGD